MKLLMNFRFLVLGGLLLSGNVLAKPVTGWLSWRGPSQNGVSTEAGLPEKWEPGGENQLWKYDLNGAGAPVIANGNLYVFGYGQFGDDPFEDVQETLVCLDANTGAKKWEKRFSDYISDVVYNRYGIGSPVIDAETGNVYLQTSNGRCVAFTPDGKQLWEISLMEELSRLTFPNGRTGSAAVDGPLVIFHCVTANWGKTGPARDRFYAFDKITGELVWYSTPGVRPVDSSFCMPTFGDLGDQRVFYAGTGCGNIVCVNARTGKPVWRFQLSQGGVNSQVILHGKSQLVAIHGKENVDSSAKGRLVCLNIPTEYPKEQIVLSPEAEAWRNDEHINFTSSPILVKDRVYTTNFTGELIAVDASNGKTLWKEKLAPDQIHASPTYGDGKIYAPWFEGSFAIVKPEGDKPTVLSKAEVKSADGSGVKCLAPPAIWGGKVYLSTRDGLYCFGNKEGQFSQAASMGGELIGDVAQLQVVPAEFAIAPGQEQQFKVYGLDQSGRRTGIITDGLSWEKFIPPTAKVKAKVDATLDSKTGQLTAAKEAKISAGALKVTYKGMSATTRGRVEASIGYSEDFENTDLKMDDAKYGKVSFPPLAWLGARVKWWVTEKDGNKVIVNRLENVLFQRTMNFFGGEDMKNYTLSADVMTDGNRRIKSTVGVVNQRYLITLVGNKSILEVSSNHERVKQSVPFKIKVNQWYHLKTHVKANPDGTGEVRGKAWPKGEPEPAEWTIKVPVKRVHPQGAPGIFAFSPQAQKPVFIDNIKITAGE